MNAHSQSKKGRRGATVVEYLLLGSLIALVALGAVSALGGGMEGVFHQLAQNVPAVR
jgi:Flp pilus assembly pilin Flp